MNGSNRRFLHGQLKISQICLWYAFGAWRICSVIATPVAWIAMDRWLRNFAYRVHLEWWVFAAAGALALFIAFATVSAQAIRAALANPIRSLRSE